MAGVVSDVRAQTSCGLQNLHRPALCLSIVALGQKIHMYVPTWVHAPTEMGASAHVCAGLVW
jgi:hypothetical protein